MNAQHKTALVTGATGGIGKAVAQRLARDGFAVVVNYAGSRAAADAVTAEIRAGGGGAMAIQADVSDESQVTSMFSECLSTYGRVDVVVNAAGIMPLSLIAKADLATFDKVIAINLRGTFLVLSQAAQHVAEGGRIIAFSSSVLAKAFPGYGAYIASKAGAEGLVHVLANEMRGRSISVNAVAPGPIATDLFLKGKNEAQVADFIKMAPLERLGTPGDVTGVVSFLAGPEGAWVNGQTVRVNGGFATFA
jgi:3-oxoacyl-[acyl-carrier protein] reductase